MENELRNILFQIGKELKLHKVDAENIIVEIDYDKYVSQIMALLSDERLEDHP